MTKSCIDNKIPSQIKVENPFYLQTEYKFNCSTIVHVGFIVGTVTEIFL